MFETKKRELMELEKIVLESALTRIEKSKGMDEKNKELQKLIKFTNFYSNQGINVSFYEQKIKKYNGEVY